MSATRLTLDAGSLGIIDLELAPGMPVTPASRITLEAVVAEQHRLSGRIIDWGSGSGALAIAAARIPGVTEVLGFEIDSTAVEVAQRNVFRNRVGDVVIIIHADSFLPVDPSAPEILDRWVGKVDGLIANPPGSEGDDGLRWRRHILGDGRAFLTPGATALIQISYQYSADRIASLTSDVPGYAYEGVVGSSDWAPFDQRRSDLAALLEGFAAEEQRGGLPYTFGHPDHPDDAHITATEALARFRAHGEDPLTKWQVHCFTRVSD